MDDMLITKKTKKLNFLIILFNKYVPYINLLLLWICL